MVSQLSLLTVAEAAQALRLDHSTVRRLVRRGVLPAYRLGRAVRIGADAVERYLSQCRVHVPQLVPEATSVARTSTAAPAAPAGTPAADPSPAAASRSRPTIASRPSGASLPSSAAAPLTLADAIDAVVTMAALVPELMLELEGLSRLVANLRVEADRADCGCSRCAQGSLASQGDA